ncbi:MAG: class I tRNA ligase family protein [Candidatus Shikimatogenerans sp. JK-2022]|nr:class I tRNA ligase family protein [Candidatus Shikimatogenerans bostrichidophilus]
MFPYPSGYGLHIGHTLGYIFSDIISKYKSGLGYKILNPIGFDSFGLPAEQYAITTGNHPKIIIKKSINKYLNQIKLLGVFFNWDRIINTSSPKYYKWTQYIFLKFHQNINNNNNKKAENINNFLLKQNKIKNLNKYRLAYLKYSYVNWCPYLKSVLANDEIKNGKSLRGGHKIIQKKMLQWHLRITKYIPRLIKDLKTINWPNYIKNSQIKWIGNKYIYIFKFKIYKKYIKIYTISKSKSIKNIIFNYPSNFIDILLLKHPQKKKIIKLINKYIYKNKFFKIFINIKNNYNKNIKFFISNYYKNFYINNVYINYINDKLFLSIKNNFIINIKNYKIYFNFTFKKEYISNLKDIVFSRQRYWGEPILKESYGEVLNSETINYKTQKPELNGLFCEKIFGPIKDYECTCGKYKNIKYKGIYCDRCGIEITKKSVRRERMGHIKLAVPVIHIWGFRCLPNKISYLININSKDLESIIYYEKYIILTLGKLNYIKINNKYFKKFDLINEEIYLKIQQKIFEFNKYNRKKILIKTGGAAIYYLLKKIKLNSIFQYLNNKINKVKNIHKKKELFKRLQIIELFLKGENKSKPEYLVLSILPVIPPDLRPIVQLEGGKFASSDLNDLYRKIIIRNNRLKRLLKIDAPEVILVNEKRMLQESVDALLDNSRKIFSVKTDNNRILKSLSDILKGKLGRFRHNLLGKRVDYSARSVIVVEPNL